MRALILASLLILPDISKSQKQYTIESIDKEKKVIDTSDFRTWSSVLNGTISSDGRFVAYILYNEPVGQRKLILKAIETNKSQEYLNATAPQFTKDSKFLLFRISTDSLAVLNLENGTIFNIQHVLSYMLSSWQNTDWLGIKSSNSSLHISLINLTTLKIKTFKTAPNFAFSQSGKVFAFTSISATDSNYNCLKLLFLDKDSLMTAWSARHDSILAFSFSSNEKQLALLIQKPRANSSYREILYSLAGEPKWKSLTTDTIPEIDSGQTISSYGLEFKNDDNYILYKLEPSHKNIPPIGSVNLDVWNYKDEIIQAQQLKELKQYYYFTVAINLASRKQFRLEDKHMRLVGFTKQYALVIHDLGVTGIFEAYWNAAARPSYYLIDLQNGSTKLIRTTSGNIDDYIELSNNGKYIVYFDLKKGKYFSYQLGSGKVIDICLNKTIVWEIPRDSYHTLRIRSMRRWIGNSDFFLALDAHDIWRLDASGKLPPLNLTNYYGQRNGIVFTPFSGLSLDNEFIDDSSHLIVKAVNEHSKDWGFFKISIAERMDPTQCYIGPYVFDRWGGYDSYNESPSKAEYAQVWLVQRMSSTEAPNYFATTDFVHFIQLSNTQPQSKVNWLTTELIRWKTLNGHSSIGVLYKPENFNPKLKYPLIFDYYDKRAEELNLYIPPQSSSGRINIPWFVSRGYLVFAPDIMYDDSGPGMSAYNSIVSAALHFSHCPWVDPKKMGLQGHSFGGYETQFIISHSPLFAAACSASGFTDLIGWYNSVTRGSFGMFWAESTQGRFGKTLWESKLKYLQNSPIMHADRISTPLLLMQNSADDVVPIAQGTEMFMALRRMHKKVWLLQYDGSKHTIGGDVGIDFQERMTQFFNHFLKDQPEPLWMSRGISASQKGLDYGLGY